jgi:thermostable 8-oxoguanine DNA glycosylase
MTSPDYDRQVYHLAKDYLLGIEPVTLEMLTKYISPQAGDLRPTAITGKDGLYFRMLCSVQNTGMSPTVIGKAIGGVENLGQVLFDFDPTRVTQHYGEDATQVWSEIKKRLHPDGQLRQTNRSLWPRYCRAIVSIAQFLCQFQSAADFFEWVDVFDRDKRTRPALPWLISEQIEGMGFALACDFLKEMGYLNFGKPDVHIRRLFVALGLCRSKATDYEVFQAIVRIADAVGESAYHIDKLFWLIGSGKFYDDDVMIGRQSEAFVACAQAQLAALNA